MLNREVRQIKKLILCLFLISCLILCSCAAKTPRIENGAVVKCGELIFSLDISDEKTVAEISAPETLSGMRITIAETVICEYKGLSTEMPYSACRTVADAANAVSSVNKAVPIPQGNDENGRTIFSYSLDETRLLVYYDSRKDAVIGFFVGDRYYEMLSEN